MDRESIFRLADLREGALTPSKVSNAELDRQCTSFGHSQLKRTGQPNLYVCCEL